MSSAGVHVRRWWPVAMLLATAIVVQKVVLKSRYDVSGHAAGHLSGAGVAFAGSAIVAILLYTTPEPRTQVSVLGQRARCGSPPRCWPSSATSVLSTL